MLYRPRSNTIALVQNFYSHGHFFPPISTQKIKKYFKGWVIFKFPIKKKSYIYYFDNAILKIYDLKSLFLYKCTLNKLLVYL